MATQKEKIAAVTIGVQSFADVETALDGMQAKFATLQQAIDEVYALGVGRQGEYLKIKNRITKAAGEVAGALALVIDVHGDCTEIAKREDCDVAIPTSFAIGVVTPMDGGR
jgi:hypothetical protein